MHTKVMTLDKTSVIIHPLHATHAAQWMAIDSSHPPMNPIGIDSSNTPMTFKTIFMFFPPKSLGLYYTIIIAKFKEIVKYQLFFHCLCDIFIINLLVYKEVLWGLLLTMFLKVFMEKLL